jgi:hypothetical protein
MNNLRDTMVSLQRGERSDDLDQLLRRFYRAEMPDPWPAPPTPAEAPRPLRELPRRPFRWHQPRLALAAAVALFLIGYLWLQSAFPPSPAQVDERTPGPTIGKKDDRPKTTGRQESQPSLEVPPIRQEVLPLGKKNALFRDYQQDGRGIVIHGQLQSK